MSWYNSIGDLLGDAKKGVTNVGHAIGTVASNPWVQRAGGALFGSGTAPLLGAAGGALKPGGGIKGAVKGVGSGAVNGLEGAAAAGLAAGAGLALPAVAGAVGSAGSAVGAGGLAKAAGLAKQALGGGGVPGDGAPSDSSWLDTAKGFLTGNGGANALAVAQGANAALLGKKSSDYADNAMGSVQSNWDSRQGLRDAGTAGMLAPSAGIASKIAALPNHNAYSQPAVLPAKPAMLPMGAMPQVRPVGA